MLLVLNEFSGVKSFERSYTGFELNIFFSTYFNEFDYNLIDFFYKTVRAVLYYISNHSVKIELMAINANIICTYSAFDRGKLQGLHVFLMDSVSFIFRQSAFNDRLVIAVYYGRIYFCINVI